MEGDLDSYDITNFDLGPNMDPNLDNIEIDGMDEDLWGDY
jgi:hypothetical protein